MEKERSGSASSSAFVTPGVHQICKQRIYSIHIIILIIDTDRYNRTLLGPLFSVCQSALLDVKQDKLDRNN